MQIALTAFDVADRRRHGRIRLEECGQVAGRSGPGWTVASVTDCSDSGIGLCTSQEFECGTNIVLSWNGGYFVGNVRNARPDGNLWRVGIELELLTAHAWLLHQLKAASDGRILGKSAAG
jgi:hypothetical protein